MRRNALIKAGLIVLFLMLGVLPAGSVHQASASASWPNLFFRHRRMGGLPPAIRAAESAVPRVALGQQVSQICRTGSVDKPGAFQVLFPPLRFN